MAPLGWAEGAATPGAPAGSCSACVHHRHCIPTLEHTELQVLEQYACHTSNDSKEVVLLGEVLPSYTILKDLLHGGGLQSAAIYKGDAGVFKRYASEDNSALASSKCRRYEDGPWSELREVMLPPRGVAPDDCRVGNGRAGTARVTAMR